MLFRLIRIFIKIHVLDKSLKLLIPELVSESLIILLICIKIFVRIMLFASQEAFFQTSVN